MASTTPPLAYYKRRFVRRAFIEDLPEDLQDTGTMVVQMVMRPERIEQVAREQARHAGKRPFDRPADLLGPAMPRRSRQISVDGLRTFHMGFGDPDRVTSAATSDAYAASRSAREEEVAARRDAAIAQAGSEPELRGPAIADHYAGSHGGADGGAAMTVTNLRRDLEERKEQWDRFESQAASIGLEQQRLAEGRTLGKRRETIGARLVGEDATAMHRWVRSSDAWRSASADERKAIKFSAGRSRATYENFDVEAPAEFDGEALTRVAQGLADFIAHQPGDPAHAIEGAQVPVVVSTHMPDGLNDDRNPHFHVTNGRHRALVAADGKLVTREGALAIEPVMPPAMTRLDWRKTLRSEVARLVNVELERLDVGYRLDPGTDRAIGNDGTPMKKIFRDATVLARAGVRTPLAQENIAEGWRRYFAAIDRTRDEDLKRAKKRRVARRKRIEAEMPTEAQDELCTLADRILSIDTRAIEARHERRTIEGLIDMTRSAPEEVARYAPEYARRAMRDGRRTYDSAGWQRRADEATRFLVDLDLELAEERQAIAERLEIERQAEQGAERLVSALILDMA